MASRFGGWVAAHVALAAIFWVPGLALLAAALAVTVVELGSNPAGR